MDEETTTVNPTEINISESMREIRNYSSSSSSSSDSESDSEEDSDGDSTDSSTDSSDEDDIQEQEIIRPNKKKPVEEESWLSVLGVDKISIELPDIASLEIRDKDTFVHMGNFENIIDKIVTVAGLPNIPTYDLDTLLFLEEGKKVLGYVIDVMGPVTAPVYIIPYSSEALKDLHLEKGTKVYCAPSSKYTKYVILQDLMKVRGSDASWVGDIEVPPEFQEFSDDEQEYLNRKSKKDNKRKHNPGQQEDTDRLPVETKPNTPNMHRQQTGNSSVERQIGESRYVRPQFTNNQVNIRKPVSDRQTQNVINPAALVSHNSLSVPYVPAFNPNIPPPSFGAPPVFAHPLRNMFSLFHGGTPSQNSVPRGTSFSGNPHGFNSRQNMPGPHNGYWF